MMNSKMITTFSAIMLLSGMIAEANVAAYDDYILPGSEYYYLDEDDIVGMDAQELNYARNEIFARYGREFNSEELMDYFESQDWYVPIYSPEEFDSSVLNEYEKANVTFLLKEEKKLMPEGYQLDQPGYSFEEDDGWEDEIDETDEWELYREYFAEESFHEDMKLYHQYVQEQGLNNIIKNIQDEYTEDEILVQKITIADFDQDDRVEIWLRGPGASANAQAAILDIEDGEVECVFSDWGIELGQYDDLETGETGLVIMEGNSEGDYYFHSWLGLYDEDWNQTILCEGMAEGDEGTYYDRDGFEITEDEYGDIWSEISEECRDTDIVFEREQVDMDLDEVLYVLYLAEQGEA